MSAITDKQQTFLVNLIARRGKTAYQEAKRRVDIPAETTINNLTKFQAIRLIRQLKNED